MGRTKIVLIRLLLAFLGITTALFFLEIGLHMLPRDRFDDIIESSTRLKLYRLDPRIGWTLLPNAHYIHTNRADEVIEIKTNSLGLRDREHTYEKKPGVYRILILGDSFTEAIDVTFEESFPHLVEQCLNKQLETSIEVINAGVSGYSPGEEYLFYQSEGVKYSPDLVLLVTYVGNDLSDLDYIGGSRMITGFGGYGFDLNQGKLRWTWQSWESGNSGALPWLERFLRRYSLIYRIFTHPESKVARELARAQQMLQERFDLNDNNEEKTDKTPPWRLYVHVPDFPNHPDVPQKLKEIWFLYKTIIIRLDTEVKANGSQLALAIIPNEYQVHRLFLERAIQNFSISYRDNLLSNQWNMDEPNLTIMKFLNEQQIPALDLLVPFRSHEALGGSLLYFNGGYPQHLNRAGQELTADVLCDWLIRNDSIRLP